MKVVLITKMYMQETLIIPPNGHISFKCCSFSTNKQYQVGIKCTVSRALCIDTKSLRGNILSPFVSYVLFPPFILNLGSDFMSRGFALSTTFNRELSHN